MSKTLLLAVKAENEILSHTVHTKIPALEMALTLQSRKIAALQTELAAFKNEFILIVRERNDLAEKVERLQRA